MQGSPNWILPDEINANRFFWDSCWLEIWKNHLCPSMVLNGGSVAMDSGFCRKRSMQTSSSETLIGWKSVKTTYAPVWDWMEGAWQWTRIKMRMWKMWSLPSANPSLRWHTRNKTQLIRTRGKNPIMILYVNLKQSLDFKKKKNSSISWRQVYEIRQLPKLADIKMKPFWWVKEKLCQ